jgi:GNAT superfamily N-acetyltransferase
MGSIVFENLTDELRARLPRYPMRVLHVGQLATDSSVQGRGIGSLLLRFAGEKAIDASTTMGCFAIELIADNQMAFDWYLKRGFLPLVDGAMRLYQSVETLKRATERLVS